MFGTLKLHRCGLDVSQQELYRAAFCGSCHALRDLGGLPATLLVNYDQAFLHLVASAVAAPAGSDADAPRIEMRPCSVAWFHKVPVRPVDAVVATTTASFTLALIEAKLRDDVDDEGGLLQRGLLRSIGSLATKARAHLGQRGFDLDLLVSLPRVQAEAEREAQPTLETLAAPTAAALGGIFAHLSTLGTAPAEPLRAAGSALGRFLYVWDALCDLEGDQRKGRFNALLACPGSSTQPHQVRSWLSHELHMLEAALMEVLAAHPTSLALAHAQVKSLRSKLDARLPPPLGSRRRRAASTSWVPAWTRQAFTPGLRSPRQAAQRGDADCGACCDCGSCCEGGVSCDTCCTAAECCEACECVDACGCCDSVCEGPCEGACDSMFEACGCTSWQGNSWCFAAPAAREVRRRRRRPRGQADPPPSDSASPAPVADEASQASPPPIVGGWGARPELTGGKDAVQADKEQTP